MGRKSKKGKCQTSIPSLPSPLLVNMGRKGKCKGQTSNPSLQGQTSNPIVPSSPLPDPMPISSGSTGTEYEVHKKHVITDPNTSYSMTYYEGIIIHKGKEEHKKHRKDVCFLVRDNFDEAMRIFDLSGLISHPRVMKASSVFFDDFLNQYLVCFDRFEGLENAKKENSLAKKLNDPKLSATVPGNPGTFVRQEIKGLAKGLDHMIKNHVSSSCLNRAYGYVWCPLTSHVKIMLADTSLKKEGNTTRNPNEIIEDTLKQFSNRLKEYFLKTSEDLKTTEEKPKDIIWPGREQFLNCFTRSKVPIQNRMKMAINHPFLKSSILEILRYFPTVNHAFKSKVSCRGHNMRMFRLALNNHTRWKIRRIRNKFEHRLKGEGSVRKLYEDIQGRDPLFIGELHEKEHYAFKSKVSCRGHNMRKLRSALNNRTRRKIRGIRNKFKRRRLTACNNAEPRDVVTSKPEVPVKSGRELASPTLVIALFAAPGDPRPENHDRDSTVDDDIAEEPLRCSSSTTQINVECDDMSIWNDSQEAAARVRNSFDLNLPPEYENEPPNGDHEDETAKSQLNDVNSQRRGTRNRPPTARTLEAVAYGFLSTNTRRQKGRAGKNARKTPPTSSSSRSERAGGETEELPDLQINPVEPTITQESQSEASSGDSNRTERSNFQILPRL